MNYATYEFYTKSYGGNLIPPERFNFYANKAKTYIDRITMGRINSDTLSDKVRECCCEITEEYYRIENNKQLSSESVGGHSVSYVVDNKTPEQRLYAIAGLHLGNTGLLYRGVT